MKILRVISSMNPSAGGPCQGIRNAVPFQKKLGVLNEVVCFDETSTLYPVEDDFVIYKLGKGITAYQYHPVLLSWLKDNIFNYDFVIVHGLWQYPNLAVYRAVKHLKKKSPKVPKVIIMPHGMLDPYFQKAPERKLKAIRNELMWRLTEKKCLNAAEAVFFTCEEERRLAATTFKNYKPRKTINVGYGINPPPMFDELFKTAFAIKCPLLKGKEYWLFLSRIHPKKGIDLLIEAYNQLIAENHYLPELVIAGPTDSEYAQQMVKMAGNNNHIHFSGMLLGDAKWGAFYGCELYVLPSHQENFGIAIVEAMACKKPVVITKNINIWWEIEAGNGGWVLDQLNKESIYNTLLAISQRKDAGVIQKGENAFGTYKNKFDVEECSNVFLTTLKSL
jgi:glycosyltransferase involved in cell wall biosynthesis